MADPHRYAVPRSCAADTADRRRRLDEDELREETGLGAARMTYAGHLFEATGTTPALAWVINAIVDALAEFGVRHA